jgi:hypothetical protein
MRTILAGAFLLCFFGCVHGPTQATLQHQAGEVCWKLRETVKDWRLAATTCAQQLQQMDGVKAAWVDGTLVRVKFEDFKDSYGIYMR